MRWKGLRSALGLLLAASSSGCTYEEADFPSQEELYDEQVSEGAFLLQAGRGSFTVEVDGRGMLAPEVNVGRYTSPDDRAMRGTAFSRPVNLAIEGGRVSGLVGTTPVQLTVTRESGALRARGLIRGRLSDFTLGEGRLNGQIGACGYDLAWTARAGYEGARSCGGLPENATVRIPAELTRWSDAEVAAALAILLGSG